MHIPRPIGRMIEIAFFAPIGLLSVLKDQWPTVTKRLGQERQAVINRGQLAQLAVRVAAQRVGEAPKATETTSAASRSQAPQGTVTMTQPPVDASELPISDYQSLAAIHVVDRLTTLRPDELEQVRAFEQANRSRRTILAKIEHLQESAP